MVDALVNDMNLEKVTFLKSHVVTKVDWSNDTVANVTCSNGEEFSGDFVISTTSLGCLKENHTGMFEPPLPTKKASAIDAFGYGVVGKVFLEFPTAFWNNDPAMNFLYK